MVRRLAAILAADIAGFGRLMEADEQATVAALKLWRQSILDPLVLRHHGRMVKVMGDGVLVEFPSAVSAVECAIELQKQMTEANIGARDDRQIVLRVGINLGDMIVEGDDLYGDGVNVAARLEQLAPPGGILISGSVYDQVKNKLGLSYSDLGPQMVKNHSEPVRIYCAAESGAIEGKPGIASADPLSLPSRPSIAVLPFANLSDDPGQTYFSDGISEDIITDLSKVSELFVIARNSTFTYRDRSVRVQEVGRELGVRYVLEGSVRKAANRVRITAQLIDAITGGHLWAERYDRELTDIFAVQDEITGEIVSALAVTLSPDEQQRLERKGSGNIEAYDHYLRGADQLWLFTKDSCTAARRELELAIELDPTLVSAYSILSHAHLIDYVNQWREPTEESLRLAFNLAQQAVRLNNDDALAHWQLGLTCLWQRQHDQAIAELRRAVALDRNLARAQASLGHALSYAGRPQEAISPLKTALRLDPTADIFLHFLAEAYFGLKDYEQAAATLRRRIMRKPDTDVSRVLLASCYGHLGRFEEAKANWQEALRFNPDYSLEHKRRILPYRTSADFEHIVEGLRKAGLPA